MSFLRRLAASTTGYTAILAVITLLLLLGVGLGADALPFPPQSTYSDAAVSHWPAALYLQQSLRNGAWPLWRDLLMSGQPFAANPLNKVWYPPQWLAILLPATIHLNLMIWAHLVLAGSGMCALGRRLEISSAGIMGIAYALAPRLLAAVGAGHLDIVYAAAWFPWVLWAVHYAITGSQHIGRRIAALSVIGAFCFLADVRLSVFVFATAVAFGLWLIWSTRRYTLVLLAAVSLLLAAGLTAVEWLPLAPLAPYLSRGDMTPADAAIYSLQPVQLIGLALPDRGGFHETMIYAGLTILILAFIALARALRRCWFWLLAILIAALYALGDQGPLWPLLVRIAPPLLWLRVPSRAWIVVALSLIVLAGYGLQALADHSLRTRVLALVSAGLLGTGIALGIALNLIGLPLRPGAGLSTVVGLIAMGLLLLFSQWLSTGTLFVVAATLIALDLLWTDISLARGLPQSVWLDAYAPLAQALRDEEVTRLYSPDYSLPQQAAAYWQIPQFGGIDPFQLRGYVPAFEQATGTHAAGYSVTLPPFDTEDIQQANQRAVIDADLLGRWNVSHVLSGYPIDNPGLALINRPDNLYLYKILRAPAHVTFTWDSPNQFTAHNQSDQPVNVAAWAPGWTVAGSDPTGSAAIVVAPGQTITASYAAPGLAPALALSTLSLIFVGAAGLYRR